MFLFRRSVLCAACALLALAFAAAEELVVGEAGLFSGASAAFGRAELFEALGDAEPGSTQADEIRAAPSALDGAGDGSKRVYRICRVTAYCDRGLTASGARSGPGQCAAPADIPFGSIVYIPALDQSFVVTDRTHARFRRNTVDIFMPSREMCRTFGRRYLECEFIINERPWRYDEARRLSDWQ